MFERNGIRYEITRYGNGSIVRALYKNKVYNFCTETKSEYSRDVHCPIASGFVYPATTPYWDRDVGDYVVENPGGMYNDAARVVEFAEKLILSGRGREGKGRLNQVPLSVIRGA